MQTSFRDALAQIANGDHHDPHQILGLHDVKSGKVIRLFRPGAYAVHIELFGKIVPAQNIPGTGFFEVVVPPQTSNHDYRIYHQNGLLANDPYAFWPTVSEFDQYLFNQGVNYQLYNVLGAHSIVHDGVKGVKFSVWAPSARRVSIVGDFNYWDGRQNPMRSLGASGIWEIFIPGLTTGARYKYEIKASDGSLQLKSDPFAFSSELRPMTASIVANVNRFEWEDQQWLSNRAAEATLPKPMTIYEIHLGSWKKSDEEFLNYKDLARLLAPYCKKMGFTHVELLPIQEHPLDESWGYQVTGFYAPTSRHGTPMDFQWFVNHMHKNGIGIILDWVPGHFPTDSFSLARFDGTALYEHADSRQGFHPHWSTYIFNYGRKEVSNFLVANALFWLDYMHIDGLRVDAVASMLYLDYGREPGEWIPNKYGGHVNLEAVEFLKHFNSIVHQQFPGALTIAEESTSFSGVSHPLEKGGLGFDYKWNMGWMNDTLRYFSKDAIYRSYHQNDLTFGLLYAFSEKFILVLSHDEVVHGKNSLLGKMPGDSWQQFANMRLLYSYMICQPGKKLLFMGGEIGQWNEWNCKNEIEWFLLQFPNHQGIQKLVEELNHFYLEHPTFWENDDNYSCFQWVDFNDRQNCVICYLRKSIAGNFLCVHNFTPTYHPHYLINLRGLYHASEVFNSDDLKYGGSGQCNPNPTILRDDQEDAYGLQIQLAPLATMIFKIIKF
ncbi:MAG: 1,4-alpha-glucan branching protein GlgB [Parachlamydiaceae bacterium]|nr:1,4-alpha-glucan branching protein GlgB [Parachlamydiaceae bacterium]